MNAYTSTQLNAFRPRYHFSPPRNWMNDPNGLIQWSHHYHLFYQYNPYSASHGHIHWGHAVSRDLIHWQHLPVALAPTPGGPDADGCWSGCAVDNAGIPTLIYTGVFPESQCMATSDDGLLTWKKDPANPRVRPPTQLALGGFRDPCVWAEDADWHMVLGANIEGRGPAILHFTTDDLSREWRYHGVLTEEIGEDTKLMWECPSFFELGGKHILILSIAPRLRVDYLVGTWRGADFRAEQRGLVDFGRHFYAPQTFADNQNRRLMFGWLWEGWSDEAARCAGWAGVMSLPRILRTSPTGKLQSAPALEVDTLRGDFVPSASWETPRPPRLEVSATLRAAQHVTGFRFAFSNSEFVDVVLDGHRQEVRLERHLADWEAHGDRDAQSLPCSLDAQSPLDLRCFIDHSVIEIYLGDGSVLSSRIYPQCWTAAENPEVCLFLLPGAEQILDSCSVYEITALHFAVAAAQGE